MNNTVNGTGWIAQDFAVKYGPVPFTMHQTYQPVNVTAEGGGLYSKYVNGAKGLLQLPTVVVDVEGGSGTGGYATMIEYTCKPIIIEVQELRFLARTPAVDASTLKAMFATAARAGVPAGTIKSMQVVNRTKCS